MADTKISALPASTTPLAGTETLPIVQGGVTKKVSVANLTAGRSVATAGGSFTDNITQGTAAKGVNFTANTPAAGMTSQLLNWYEEGTWTPNQGGGLTVSGTFSSNGTYTRVGRTVTVYGQISATTSVAASGAISTNLPYAPAGNVTGTYLTGAAASSGVIWAAGATIYTAGAGIGATSDIWFSFTYQI